jgi:hypothetical protein
VFFVTNDDRVVIAQVYDCSTKQCTKIFGKSLPGTLFFGKEEKKKNKMNEMLQFFKNVIYSNGRKLCAQLAHQILCERLKRFFETLPL